MVLLRAFLCCDKHTRTDELLLSPSQKLRNSSSLIFPRPLVRPRAGWLGGVADQVSALAVEHRQDNAPVGLAGEGSRCEGTCSGFPTVGKLRNCGGAGSEATPL